MPLDESAAPVAARRAAIMFSDTYSRLPPGFFARLDPTPVANPRLLNFNRPLAEELGVDPALDAAELAAIFSGNDVVPGSAPIAMAYAGHQFGQFVPQLGDGRAILLGEVVDSRGRRRDVQLKGAGRTPYSRGGDGRAALGPVLREYLVSEAMYALGIPATRALAAVATGEDVFRGGPPTPGAILTRVAAGHVRVGTFQFFAARGDTDATQRLADYVIDRHYPDAARATNPYLELLRSVTLNQARLVAGWMAVGFIHGVMNTDNMAISGETIDFGPCAFLDAYDPATVFSSIDHRGRYSYQNQPAAAQWNLARFAETLLPLIDSEPDRAVAMAGEAVSRFSAAFEGYRLTALRSKLGLATADAGDDGLIAELLDAMQRAGADYTVTFRRLCDAAGAADDDAIAGDASLLDALGGTPASREWLAKWRSRLGREPLTAAQCAAGMRSVNPAVIPRNHRIEQVIAAASEHDDFGPFEQLGLVLARPFERQRSFAEYEQPPQHHERVLHTFCGT